MGIPNQVQKELGTSKHSPRVTLSMSLAVNILFLLAELHRSFQKALSTQHHDQDEALPNSHPGVIVTSTDGENPGAKKGGARVHLSELEVGSSAGTIQHP